MSISLDITLDRRNIAKFRTLLKANRTIAAKSLTFVAYKARDDWRAAFPSTFHLRRKWLITGARVENATAGRLQSAVYHLDQYLDRHVEGLDTPKVTGGKGLFVPIEDVASQPTHKQIRANLRRAARTKNKPFWRNGKLLWRYTGANDSPLKVLAVMRQSVDIKPRFDALGRTERAVQAHFPTVYEKLLLQWAASA